MRPVRHVWLAVAALAAGCRPTPPPGYQGGAGDRWTFPLVGPLESEPLIAPVAVDGQGPYLFVIDPDANVSAVDEELIKQLRLQAVQGPDRLDVTGTPRPRFYATLGSLELGTLILDNRDVMIASAGAFDTDGRRIHGVLGKDVLADALVFGFDRDAGVGHLVTAGVFRPPAGAASLPYTALAPVAAPAGAAAPLPRRVVAATVGQASAALHLDLGAAHSQLREDRWPDAGLAPLEGRIRLVDETGTAREASRVARGAVGAGPLAGVEVVFAPFEDARFPAGQLDGTLGLDAFRDRQVWVSWAARTVHLAPRTPAPLATRAARWEVAALARCARPGCVTLRVVDPLAGKPADPARPHPGLVLSATREEVTGGMGLEVVVEAIGRPDLPRIAINLPATADRALGHLKPAWVGAALEVVDVSPFPRACPSAEGCIDLLAR